MQPSSRDMHGSDGGGGAQDDFFDQMLSTLPSAWADLGSGKSPWELVGAAAPGEDVPAEAAAFDESAMLASRLRQHRIGGSGGGGGAGEKPVMLQLSDLHRNGLAGGEESGGGGFLPLPLFADRSAAAPREEIEAGTGGDQAMYNGFGGAGMHGAAAMQPPFGRGGSMSAQSFGGPAASAGAAPAAAPSSGAGGGGAPPPRQQRVRARRGQATDPHSIAERLRRERIAERMKSLQELVPNANKTDKASMLDEIIDYVKFLQLQVKVLSMSRLGAAAAVAPLVANMSSEGNGNGSSNSSSGNGKAANGNSERANGGLRVTEQQVARLMEEDMGSAMQYLQGKGLCLMPISLASAISSATSSASLLSRPALRPAGDSGPTSPGLANDGAGGNDTRSRKDAGASRKQ